MRVKCFAQEHNTISSARARTRSTRSGDERTNHETTGLPTKEGRGIICSKIRGHTHMNTEMNNTVCRSLGNSRGVYM